jgi:hypothetical protein
MNWGRVLKSVQIKKWTKSLKDHLKISKYTKFENVYMNTLRIISVRKLWNYWRPQKQKLQYIS